MGKKLAVKKSVKKLGTIKKASKLKKSKPAPLKRVTSQKSKVGTRKTSTTQKVNVRSPSKTKKRSPNKKREAEKKAEILLSPSEYEKKAIKEIHAWKNPKIGWFGQAMTVINKPLSQFGDLVFQTTFLGEGIRKTVEGIIKVGNDVAQGSVRPSSIYQHFRDHGHNIHKAQDVLTLDLEKVDDVVGFLDAKYKGVALVEGGITGAAGLPGIVFDLPALITLNLRAIGEYATYYGYDTRLQPERLFAMNILAYASSPNDSAKAAALAQLVRIARDVAKKQAWKNLEQNSFVQIMKQIAKALGVRLTKAKLAQSIPIAGAVVGAGFNSYYTAKVCDAAYYLYRERFLAEKYGESIIEQTVPPAEDLDPEYQEANEDIFGKP